MAPWGIFTLYVGCNRGLRGVISPSISGRVLAIFAESLTERKARKVFSDEIIYFLKRKRNFGGRVGKERSGKLREKGEDSKGFYKMIFE